MDRLNQSMALPSKDALFEALFAAYPALSPLRPALQSAYALLAACAKAKATVYVCGNGGSAADSEHIVGELMKGFLRRRPLPAAAQARFAALPGGAELADKLQSGIRAISLVSQTGLISAFANDADPAAVYAQQVFAYAQAPEDVLLALSTSGNSLNILNAAIAAKAAGIRVLAITGAGGGKLAPLADAALCLPAEGAAQVQELTLPVYHALCAMLEAELFDI